MKVIGKHVLEIKHGINSIIPFEFDQLDDGRYLLHHRTGIRIITNDEFNEIEKTKELPKQPR